MKPSKPFSVVRLSEAQIQKTCTEFLALDGWRAIRTDPVSDRSRGKGFGELGMADYLYVRYSNSNPRINFRVAAMNYGPRSLCETMWIEWKRIKGKNATKATTQQWEWHQAERARGALTLVAGLDFPATIEGFIEWYKTSGLQRKVDR